MLSIDIAQNHLPQMDSKLRNDHLSLLDCEICLVSHFSICLTQLTAFELRCNWPTSPDSRTNTLTDCLLSLEINGLIVMFTSYLLFVYMLLFFLIKVDQMTNVACNVCHLRLSSLENMNGNIAVEKYFRKYYNRMTLVCMFLEVAWLTWFDMHF